jgi:hypothetical protein
MGWRSVDLVCGQCHREEIRVIALNDYLDGVFPICSECGGETLYKFNAPMVTKASYPDGMTNRFSLLKEQAKLEKEKASTRHSERGKIAQEIRNLASKKG